MALGNMVGNLTVGKKKYADVEDDLKATMERAAMLQNKLLTLIDKDAEAFEPLAAAYGIPKDDPGRAAVMEAALREACSAPIEIMRTAAAAIKLQEDFARNGSALAVSDAGVGAALCKAALQGASLNVYINTKSMQDRDYAKVLESEADGLLEKYCPLADEIFNNVSKRLKG
jgi:formiminotetrahydrofolate cyclodeaminase